MVSKATRRCKHIPVKIPKTLLAELGEIILPFMWITKASPLAVTKAYHFILWVLDPQFMCFYPFLLFLLNPLPPAPIQSFSFISAPYLEAKSSESSSGPEFFLLAYVGSHKRKVLFGPNSLPWPPGMSLALCFFFSLISCLFLLSSLHSNILTRPKSSRPLQTTGEFCCWYCS